MIYGLLTNHIISNNFYKIMKCISKAFIIKKTIKLYVNF